MYTIDNENYLLLQGKGTQIYEILFCDYPLLTFIFVM